MTIDEVLLDVVYDEVTKDDLCIEDSVVSLLREIVRLRKQLAAVTRERDALDLSLAKKAESYRAAVLTAEAETKQWKEFFYGQCDKAERAERVVEVRRLREAVELAYQEGWMHGHIHGKTEVKLAAPPAMYDDYDTSNAKRDLEAQ